LFVSLHPTGSHDTHSFEPTVLPSLAQGPPPVSNAMLACYAVNSFTFTNAEGAVNFGRYRIEPRVGIQYLPVEERAKADSG
jgi:catalase